MHLVLKIAVIIISGLIYLYTRRKKWKRAVKSTSLFTETENKVLIKGELHQDQVWWTYLETSLQLELALALALKALPVWQRNSETDQLNYKNSPVSSPIIIRASLLQTSLDEIVKASKFGFPENNKNIVSCYNEFLGPLVALQDGNWAIPYPVKRIFLSVYNILKGITQQEDKRSTRSLLALSINQSLDCIDMCKLYNREEINSFLEPYRRIIC